MLKKSVVLVVFTCLCGYVFAADIESKISASRVAVKSFGSALKSELVSAMKSGGPLNAVGVCNVSAPQIAQSVSTESDFTVSRTSLKFRNAANAPTEWQQKILQDFEASKNGGQEPGKLEYAELVKTGSGQEYRYMKAIPTGEVCLNCHGSSLSGKLHEKITALYPDDKATGYSIGDIRGAFVVVEQID